MLCVIVLWLIRKKQLYCKKNSELIEMSKVCEVCGKAPVAGRSISHSHRVSNRTFRPNVQKVTINDNGHVRKANICTKCLKAGKVVRA